MTIAESKQVELVDRLTTTEFWNECYKDRDLVPFDPTDWRNLVQIQLVELLTSLQLSNKKICEVGGGDAKITSYLASKYNKSEFSVLDFSPLGCDLARARAKVESVNLNVVQADVFSPPSNSVGVYDLVISHGVVEHFTDLSSILKAKAALLRKGGQLFTLIPNFESPIYAALCKHWSVSVFEDHVPHTMSSFVEGHKQAGLKIMKCDYFGSSEFGMLSMAMNGPERKTSADRFAYLWLTRVSKLMHLIEWKTGWRPSSKLFSPFMYALSSIDEAAN